MSEYLDPADEQDDRSSERIQNTHKDAARNKKKATIETKGPVKSRKYKVLHPDGSLADDLPDKEATGSGALDGVVGRGT
jgi:hypothetical protein